MGATPAVSSPWRFASTIPTSAWFRDRADNDPFDADYTPPWKDNVLVVGSAAGNVEGPESTGISFNAQAAVRLRRLLSTHGRVLDDAVREKRAQIEREITDRAEGILTTEEMYREVFETLDIGASGAGDADDATRGSSVPPPKPPSRSRRNRESMDVLERYRPIVDDYDAFVAACERPLPAVVRVNTIKASVERARDALAAEDIAVDPAEWHDGLLRLPDDQPGANWPYFHGWLHGQEEVSALPATVLDPSPGDRVWDACAAPGSKTTQLAALMDDTGLLVATDDNMGRLSALRSNAERLGVTNVAVTREDARNHSLSPFGDEPYDRALVDVPCSCEGTIRKNPDALDEWELSHVEGVAGVQKGILKRAVQATRPGGTVVYSTCTFAPEENESVLDHVLGAEPCRLVEVDLPFESVAGVTEWDGDLFDESVARARRIYPHHNDTGGFFCAKLEVGG